MLSTRKAKDTLTMQRETCFPKALSTTYVIEGYGVTPRVQISQRRIPKDHTSDLVENRAYWKTSGAAHLIGNFVPSEAVYSSSSVMRARPKSATWGKGTGKRKRRALQLSLLCFCQQEEPDERRQTYLDDVVLANKAVSRRQIAVDKAVVFQKAHGAADLHAHVMQHLALLLQRRLVVAQVVQKATVYHELCNNIDGANGGADAVQPDQVLVLKLGHDLPGGSEKGRGKGC